MEVSTMFYICIILRFYLVRQNLDVGLVTTTYIFCAHQVKMLTQSQAGNDL